MNLTQLSIGEVGEVVEILAQNKQRRRLLDLGLTKGTKVVAKRRSPTGDPTAFLIRGTIIALRSEETDLILVKIKKRGRI